MFVGGMQSFGEACAGVPALAPAAQGFPAMLDGTAARRNSLRALRALRSDRRRKHEVEARCARWPSHLRFSAAHRHARAGLPEALRRCGWTIKAGVVILNNDASFSMFQRATIVPVLRAVCLWASLCAAEQRRLGGGARSALQLLTRGSCLSGAGQVARVASSAAHPQGEQRRGVGAKRRPARCDAQRHTACSTTPTAPAKQPVDHKQS